MQATVEEALNKQAKAAEVDALRRIEAATAQTLQSVKPPSPQKQTSEIIQIQPVYSTNGSE